MLSIESPSDEEYSWLTVLRIKRNLYGLGLSYDEMMRPQETHLAVRLSAPQHIITARKMICRYAWLMRVWSTEPHCITE